MVPKKLTQIGNPLIRTTTKKVVQITDKKTQKLIADMTVALRKFNLVGIAANQIGVNAQIFLTEIRRTKTRNPKEPDALRVFINPTILSTSKKQTILIEGCGSLAHAGLFGPVRRPERVTVTAYDEEGKKFTLTADGLLAKVIQHEYDHLHGISILDKFTNTKLVSDRDEI